MDKNLSISIQGVEVALLAHKKQDYISLTDMARYKNAEATGYVISRWLSARYTIEFIGIWEKTNNPVFNV
ncbi:MAG: KilA-N domain-containing protein, partial [Endomicrobium sp.]|nr:KilA-N domain-containing protein [Endomicrobium sp.]